jgi:hypothetical protein
MKPSLLLRIVATLLLTCSCGPSESPDSKVFQIIGPDERTHASHHYDELVGSLRFGDFHVCTAFLSAPNTVSTATHCAPSREDIHLYLFVTQNGTPIALTRRLTHANSAYVSFETAKPTSQYLEFATLNENQPIELISYSERYHDLRASRSGSFTTTPRGILHKLDTEAGSSGSPLIQNGRVVGVHEGAVNGQELNYATRTIEVHTSHSNFDLQLDFEWKCNSQCSWYQPDCYIWKELNCSTGLITVCGRNLTVPLISYSACQLAVGSLPATCTAGSLMTAGTACAANIGIAAAVCGVSIEQIYEVGKACTKNL